MEHIQSQIDNEILNAFAPTDLDSILKLTEASEDVEPWDPYFNVECFSSLNNPHAWYKLNKVRVNYVWTDEKNKKLYIFLLDKNGEKQPAEVPTDLVEFYNTRDLIGKVFSLNHFQIAYTDPTQYPRYQNYSLSRCDWVILVNNKTELTEIPLTKHSEFPAHPWITSIRGLCTDKSTKKMLIDTIGRVTKGGLLCHSGGTACELFLRDVTGAEIQFIIYHTFLEQWKKLATVLREMGVIYVSHAKLIHKEPMNLLVDTELTQIETNPTTRQAEALKDMKI